MILIKGMDRPEECRFCPCETENQMCGAMGMVSTEKKETPELGIRPDCPMIEMGTCQTCQYFGREGVDREKLVCSLRKIGLSSATPDRYCDMWKMKEITVICVSLW